MKYIKLIIAFCGTALTTFAQNKGIEFRNFENWKSLLEVSKNENKPIFVDFFTTWCGPCKAMDRDVYTDSLTGVYFNANFISVKVQMDKTKKDGDQIRKWYPEITHLEKRYEVDGYPALLFINSNGEVLNRVNGYQGKIKFRESAKLALKPGQKYTNPATRYYNLIKDYHKRLINGDSLVKALYDFHENSKGLLTSKYMYFEGSDKIKDTLTSIVLDYLRKQPTDVLFKKDILEIVGTVGVTIKDPLFKLFYPNTEKTDNIVNKNNFSRLVVDRAIRREYFKRIPDAHRVSYRSGFNWDSLYMVIKLKYGSDYASRAIDVAKNTVAYQIHDFAKNPVNVEYVNGLIDLIKRYGTNVILIYGADIAWGGSKPFLGANLDNLERTLIENFCFSHLVYGNLDQVSEGTEIMEQIVKWGRNNQALGFTDWGHTYAWLLYKAGQNAKAYTILEEGCDFAEKNIEKDSMSMLLKRNQESVTLMKSNKIKIASNSN